MIKELTLLTKNQRKKAERKVEELKLELKKTESDNLSAAIVYGSELCAASLNAEETAIASRIRLLEEFINGNIKFSDEGRLNFDMRKNHEALASINKDIERIQRRLDNIQEIKELLK